MNTAISNPQLFIATRRKQQDADKQRAKGKTGVTRVNRLVSWDYSPKSLRRETEKNCEHNAA